MKFFESSSSEDERNVVFAKHLRAWLRDQSIDTEPLVGVVLVLQMEDGFNVLQLGEHAYSDGKLMLYMSHVAETMQAAISKLN